MKKNNISIVLIVTVLVSFLCGIIGASLAGVTTKTAASVANGNIKITGSSSSESNSISESVAKVYDSVVVIEGIKNNQIVSSGTGFIYKKASGKSYIMTNHHVISGCDKIKIILSNKKELSATVRGSEAYSDIAVLTVDSKDAPSVAVLGKSDKTRVGDTLFAIGSPEGADYAGTVTKGILSGKNRMIAVALSNSNTSDYYMKVLQTDTAINPGNSGGPLCNINGEVIGITNMKLVDNNVEGMGFAIPIEDAIYYAAILENGNSIERPYLGVSILDITDSYYLWQNRIVVPEGIKKGVAILEVSKASPASRAGLKKGDIVTKISGEEISSAAEFRYQLYKHKVGEKIEITYIRNGKTNTIKARLARGSK